MSTSEVISKVRELRELRRMAEELEAEITAIRESIQAHMTASGVEELAGTDWRITWKNVTSNRLDSTALKKELPEIAARFMKQSTARRFVLS